MGFLPLWAQVTPEEMDRLSKSDFIERKNSQDIKVVSASRSSTKISDLPTSIQVITREEIERNGYVTLVDVLKHVSGIRTSKPGNGVDGETFLMRGLIGNYYTKILINSIPIQPSVTGSIAIAEQLPVVNADRIEIIFGPSSALYGGDAMAGVINIITRSTDNQPFAQATVTTGDYGYRYASLTAGGKAGKDKNIISYSIYGNFAQRDDLNVRKNTENYSSLETNTLPEELKAEARQNPDQFLLFLKNQGYPYYSGTVLNPTLGKMPQRSYMIGGQVEYRNFQGSYLEMDRTSFYSTGLTPVIFGYNNPDAFYGDKIRRLTASYNKQGEKVAYTANLSYNQYRYNTRSSRAATYDGFNGRAFKYQASDDIFFENFARYTTSKKWDWTFGASVQFSSVLPETMDLETPFDPSDYRPFTNRKPKPHDLYGDFGQNPTSFFNVGLFAQGVKITDKVSQIWGLRLDLNSAIADDPFTLRYAIQAKVYQGLSVRFAVGGAFKQPAPYLMYVSTALPGTFYSSISYQQIPNTNIVPEVILNPELGMRYDIAPNTFLEVIVNKQIFPRRINARFVPIDKEKYPKAIDFNGAQGARVYANDSSSRSVLNSLQIILKQRNLFRNLKMNIEASATFNDGEDDLAGEQGVIPVYRMVPFFLGQFSVDFVPRKNWYVRLESVWSSRWHRRYITDTKDYQSAYNTIPGYYNLDLVVRYKWSKHIHTNLKVLNVFNAEYGGIDATGLDIDLRYNPQLGRNIQLGVNFNLE